MTMDAFSVCFSLRRRWWEWLSMKHEQCLRYVWQLVHFGGQVSRVMFNYDACNDSNDDGWLTARHFDNDIFPIVIPFHDCFANCIALLHKPYHSIHRIWPASNLFHQSFFQYPFLVFFFLFFFYKLYIKVHANIIYIMASILDLWFSIYNL